MQVNKQFRREYCAELFRVWDAVVILFDSGTTPNTALKDTFHERSILANAKSWELGGYVGGSSGPEPQYSHLDDGVRSWFGVSKAQYARMVERVEAAVRTAVCECEKGLTFESASNIIDAFHLNDPADDDDDGENGDGLLDEYGGEEVAWTSDDTGRGSGIW
ncbi:hypothetical protein LTR12_013182 [Friedmanniomyces endolithicus]|nr:hypothetical protein LTR12_013182 [Friedmanniomyces endolithicus]